MSSDRQQPSEGRPGAGGDLIARVKQGASRAGRLFAVAFKGFSEHHCTQLAASMGYYALFSVFPAAIVAAAAAGFFLDDPTARTDAVDFLLEELPLSDEQGRSDLEQIIDGVANNSGTLGLVGVLGLLVSSSALVSAARNSLNIIWGGEVTRGAIRGKALDVLLIVVVGALLALSFAATLLSQLNVELGASGIGDFIETVLGTTGYFIPLVFTGLVFGVLYRVLPTSHPPVRDIWPGLVFASIGYEVLKQGFSFYLDNFSNYSAVYGSLGAVIAFMFFIYLAGIVFLLGAEMAAVWPEVRAGAHDPDPNDSDDRSTGEKVMDAVKGLFARGHHGEDVDPVDTPPSPPPPRRRTGD